MHVLVIFVVVGVFLYLYLSTRAPTQADHDAAVASMPHLAHVVGRRLAFISRGKLFFLDNNKELKELHSPYVQGVMDRMERARQRHGWKKGTAFEMSFVAGHGNIASDQVEIRATTAQFTPEGGMLYFLRDENVGGLFEYDFATGNERRLVHQQRLLLDDLSLDPTGQRLICAQHSANGTANIGLCDADGSNFQDITGGDTVDSAPAWIPDEPDKIVFQSAGVARNEEGFVMALGPATIQLLDLQRRDLMTVRQADGFDFMQPKVGPLGDLYFIRRPYEPPRYRGSHFLVDFLLFPFRLLRAVFHYLNFFSLMYSRKPLTSAAGPRVQADLKEMLIKGKRINAERALRKENRISGVPSLVPRSWLLVRRSREGEEQVVATNVATYDITDDGNVIYSNGYGVFVLDDAHDPQVILRGKLITDLVTR